jgi:pyruvate/2-oxoglutarate/acetoin dehydrogenase E1 component
MIDTPISEQGFTAAAIGASAIGARTVSDVMFADFAFEAAGQIMLQGAKLRYMSNGGMSAPFVLRAAMGALRSSGPHHSGSYHPIFAQMPGLIVCLPSNPADAKGLIKTALRAGDPVVFLEPKALYASKGEVPRASISCPSASPGSRGRAATSPSSRPGSRWRRPKRRPGNWPPRASRPRSWTPARSCPSTSTR